jgi:hypothetical protein
MNDRPEQLPFKIEQWDDTGTQVMCLLARVGHRAIAHQAFEAAARLYPSSMVTLRRGALVMKITLEGAASIAGPFHGGGRRPPSFCRSFKLNLNG